MSEHLPVHHTFNSSKPTRDCRIAQGFEDAGKTGQYFGCMIINEVHWAVVRMDKQAFPEIFAADSVEVLKPTWVRATRL